MMVFDVISWALLIGGSFFVLVGGVGMIRLPDVYARMHAAGLTDTLGAALILLGLMVQAGIGLVAVKLAFIGVFLFFTGPTSTYALANACLGGGVKPLSADGTPIDPESDVWDAEGLDAGEEGSSASS
jgi:multicomponent Na+:H+ antiporter subunit G